MAALVPSQKIENRKLTSYLLWSAGLFSLCGLHRLYNGKTASGLLWLCTFGLLGIGQLVDLFLISNMAEKRQRQLSGDQPSIFDQQTVVAAEVSQNTLMVRLLKLAQLHGGQITVTQAVIDTGQSFETIEQELKAMVKSGYADVTNQPESGVVVYEFPELM
ncbi:MAG: TM2 domain-containing protein [Symploca sp. SIO2G7]|nr:TM2 domain-containing protein [Symploca sp. SIO2G7]